MFLPTNRHEGLTLIGTYWNGSLLLEIHRYNPNSEGGGWGVSLQGKSDFGPQGLPNNLNPEEIVDDNKEID